MIAVRVSYTYDTLTHHATIHKYNHYVYKDNCRHKYDTLTHHATIHMYKNYVYKDNCGHKYDSLSSCDNSYV